MASISFSTITVPPGEPYDIKHDRRNAENLAYVALQLLSQAQTAGFMVSDGGISGGSLAGIEQALQDLKFNYYVLDLGPIRIVLGNKSFSVQVV